MNVYEIITEKIVESLEQGVIPWRRPWKVAGHPRNFISTKKYRGINTLMLALQGYASPYWLTYKQAAERGGHVKKGERSTPVVFWKVYDAEKPREDGNGKERERRFAARYYNLFNLEQTTLAPAEETVKQPLTSCMAIVDGWEGKPQLVLDSPLNSQAAYIPSKDTIVMPLMSRFLSSEHYYATLFHELIHSTGHESRLCRDGITTEQTFGSESYSKEELIAEIGSAFLCSQAGINKPEIEENRTAYLQGWIQKLKGDSKLVISAAAQAQRAADMIFGMSQDAQDDDQDGEQTAVPSPAFIPTPEPQGLCA